jgi:predicted transcriptional regulator
VPQRLDIRKKSTGINVAIVRILRDYKKAIPVGFLAQEVGRSAPEVQSHLRNLQKVGIVKLDRDMVSIAT